MVFPHNYENFLKFASDHAKECRECSEGRFWNSEQVCCDLEDAKKKLPWDKDDYTHMVNAYILSRSDTERSPALTFDLFKLFTGDVTSLYIYMCNNISQKVRTFLQGRINKPPIIDELYIDYSTYGTRFAPNHVAGGSVPLNDEEQHCGMRIADWLPVFPNLTKLTVLYKSFNDADYETISENCKKLQKLDIRHCYSIHSIPHPRGVHDSIANMDTMKVVRYVMNYVGEITWTKPYRRGCVQYEERLNWSSWKNWEHVLHVHSNLNINSVYIRNPTDDVVHDIFSTFRNLSFLVIEGIESKEALNALLETKSGNLKALHVSAYVGRHIPMPLDLPRVFRSFPELAQLTVRRATHVIFPPSLSMPKLVKLELDVHHQDFDLSLLLRNAPFLRILHLSHSKITYQKLDGIFSDNATTLTDFSVRNVPEISKEERQDLLRKYDQIRMIGGDLCRTEDTALEECYEEAMISEQTLREFYEIKTAAHCDPYLQMTTVNENLAETSDRED